jgi:hypothetical protein
VTAPAAIGYPHSALLTLDCAVTDACRRRAAASMLDRSTTDWRPRASGGETIDVLLELAPGPHTFKLESRDTLGNPSTTTVQFTVVVTPASLIEAVERFAADGAIRDPGLADALEQLARSAATAHEVGSCNRAANLYGSFLKLVRKYDGKKIDHTAATILINDAEHLVTHCP